MFQTKKLNRNATSAICAGKAKIFPKTQCWRWVVGNTTSYLNGTGIKPYKVPPSTDEFYRPTDKYVTTANLTCYRLNFNYVTIYQILSLKKHIHSILSDIHISRRVASGGVAGVQCPPIFVFAPPPPPRFFSCPYGIFFWEKEVAVFGRKKR